MSTLANKKTVADITIIICFALFLILLIIGIAFMSVFATALSFIIAPLSFFAVVVSDDYKLYNKHNFKYYPSN